MFDIDVGALETEITDGENSIKLDHEEINRLNDCISKLAIRKSSIEKDVRNMQHRIALLRARVIIATSMTRTMLATRESIIHMLTVLHRKDILVEAKENMEKSFEKSKQHFMSACSHPLIIGYDGYEGSHNQDRDDAYGGYRICIVCGYREHSRVSDTIHFSTLVEDEARLVSTVYSLNNDEKRALEKLNIWQPIEPMIKEIFLKGNLRKFIKNLTKQDAPH